MTNVPSELLYTKEHEWIKHEPEDICTIGITHHAQDSLGDVTFVELPTVGEVFEKGSVFGVVESVKAASDLYMPMPGVITEINEDLTDEPEKVNTEPYDGGWMIKIKLSEKNLSNELLSPESYKKETSES